MMYADIRVARGIFSFFQYIPDEIILQLDFASFHIPSDAVARTCSYLAQKLGHYVMTYNRNHFNLQTPIESHLCAWVKGAALTPDQKMLLRKYEELLIPQNISLVVYQKPLVLLHPLYSPIKVLYV